MNRRLLAMAIAGIIVLLSLVTGCIPINGPSVVQVNSLLYSFSQGMLNHEASDAASVLSDNGTVKWPGGQTFDKNEFIEEFNTAFNVDRLRFITFRFDKVALLSNTLSPLATAEVTITTPESESKGTVSVELSAVQGSAWRISALDFSQLSGTTLPDVTSDKGVTRKSSVTSEEWWLELVGIH